MLSIRRLGGATAAVAAVALAAAQVASAAPAGAKVGTTYWTTGAEQVTANGLIIASTHVPAGKYHITATVLVENNLPQQSPGGYLNRVECSIFAYGNSFTARMSVAAGGYATIPIEGVVDASRATPDAFIDVECRTDDPAASPLPMAEATIVADAMGGIVDLR